MRKKYILMAAIVWAVLIALGLYYYNKPHTSAASSKTDVALDAGSLYRAFQQNETAANGQFLDKIIEVKGKIKEIGGTDQPSNIQLDAESPEGGINCSLSNVGGHIQLPPKGALITVKGKCSGYLIDVNLVDCVINP